MSKTHKIVCIVILAVLLCAGITAYAVTNYGSRDDPLITKSYLDSVVQPQLEKELQEQVNAAEQELRSSVPGEFTELTLKAGQRISCTLGGELLLRSGSASAVGALADTTEGSTAAGGSAVKTNHLYLAAEDGSGFSLSGAATVLVSGSYTLE